MKKFFISLFIVLLFAIFFLNIGKSFYAETFEVIETDLENDIVYIKNSSGFVYSFYGAEDWQEKDFCACIMFDNFTKKLAKKWAKAYRRSRSRFRTRFQRWRTTR